MELCYMCFRELKRIKFAPNLESDFDLLKKKTKIKNELAKSLSKQLFESPKHIRQKHKQHTNIDGLKTQTAVQTAKQHTNIFDKTHKHIRRNIQIRKNT